MTDNQPTLPEKTTAMEKAIRMAKEVHENVYRAPNYNSATVEPQPAIKPATAKQLLTTAKQIYDWLLTT